MGGGRGKERGGGEGREGDLVATLFVCFHTKRIFDSEWMFSLLVLLSPPVLSSEKNFDRKRWNVNVEFQVSA